MIPWLAELLAGNESFSFLRVGSYITVRAAGALILSFGLSVLFGNRVIEYLRRLKVGQQIRDSQGDGAISLLEMHKEKAGRPTMGGVLMLGALLVSAIIFGDWREPVFRLAVGMAAGFAVIGFIDDYRKVVRKNSAGLSARGKLLGQTLLAAFLAIMMLTIHSGTTHYAHLGLTGTGYLAMPFLKDVVLPLGIFYIPFVILILMGTSNAVNLTDGLDGLATGVTIPATLCFAVVAYLAGRTDMSAYLIIPHVQGAGELAVLMAALIGVCFGFLWFNVYPAVVFMGDTGSMMIGGLLGSVAILLKQEVLLFIVGGVYVAEALSVILQVSSYKLRGKRLFRMSPIHHHFEKLLIPEPRIMVRFWIVSALLALAGLSTLKLR
ncbi:MAG: phospho-N-acetylmuramoyl-pentapeptide-transferase [Candidatus Sumerlaeota bacterium]|nr:phospho-N-acetylmuramoyl-pentapeptide-transferase [Candidatus Sumerlaeota bacterium]